MLYIRQISFALLILASLSLSVLLSCNHKDDEILTPDGKIQLLADSISENTENVVLVTDSDEWRCRVFKEHVKLEDLKLYALPSPWRLPTHDEAKVMRHYEYKTDAGERFFTDDGYTFQMPSPSVTQAGSKKTYTIIGLWRRRTVIEVRF